MPEGIKEARLWWLDRVKEPSTYQGLSLLAGVVGQYFFGSAVAGEHALQIGLAIAGLIGMGKSEAVVNRDY